MRLYGTSYDCGCGLLQPSAPFWGSEAYASPDLVHWRDEGFLFDAATPRWQERCAEAGRGAYGFGYDDANPYPGGSAWYAPRADAAWRAEPGRDLRFEAFVAPGRGPR
jgi:hypothetical protein